MYQSIDKEKKTKKVSIMKSSLSREHLDTINHRDQIDFIGPGYYRPKALFGKKVSSSITIPKDARHLDPIKRVREHS